MRVVIVGPIAARQRMRADLAAAGIEIVAEFPTLAVARSAGVQSDAVVLTTTTVADDHYVFDADAAGAEQEQQRLRTVESLTDREREVLNLVAEGLSNKAIAVRLRISDQTVKFHVASICGKLGAMNRTDAVRRAARLGIITL